MKIKIRHRWNGHVIKTVEAADNDNLRGADLSGANLLCADLRGADLRGADLSGANLSGADLIEANLQFANLSGANLIMADLSWANLSMAKNVPLIINGLQWIVQISGTGWMQIGCEQHSVTDWDGFDDERINSMHSEALIFWKSNKDMLMGLCRQYVHQERD